MSLTFDDTTNATTSGTLNGTSGANGGAGGTATANLALTGTKAVCANSDDADGGTALGAAQAMWLRRSPDSHLNRFIVHYLHVGEGCSDWTS